MISSVARVNGKIVGLVPILDPVQGQGGRLTRLLLVCSSTDQATRPTENTRSSTDALRTCHPVSSLAWEWWKL